MNSRRNFIKQSALFVAGAAVLPAYAYSSFAKRPLGIQLYTLRDLIAKDVSGVLSKITAMGYKEVETFDYHPKAGFWGLKAKDFAHLLKENGLKAPSGHYAMDNFMAGKNQDELKWYIDAAKETGGKYITIPWLDERVRKDADGYRRCAEHFNEAGIICKNSGLKLAYHNHDFEFKQFDGKTGLSILIENTEKELVDFELDLYWAVRSGNNPINLLKTYPDRFSMFHVKDMDKTNKDLNTEIGKGAIDFKTILAYAAKTGAKHYFVEQETNYKPNELDSVKTSFDYLQKLKL